MVTQTNPCWFVHHRTWRRRFSKWDSCSWAFSSPTCDKMPYFFCAPRLPFCSQCSNPPVLVIWSFVWNCVIPTKGGIFARLRYLYLYISDVTPSLVKSLLCDQSKLYVQSSLHEWALLVGVKSTWVWPALNASKSESDKGKVKSTKAAQSRSPLNFFTPSPFLFINLTNRFFLCRFTDITCARSYSFDSFFVNITNAVK